jgi:hypothetical protein
VKAPPIIEPRCGRNGATQVPIAAIASMEKKNTLPARRWARPPLENMSAPVPESSPTPPAPIWEKSTTLATDRTSQELSGFTYKCMVVTKSLSPLGSRRHRLRAARVPYQRPVVHPANPGKMAGGSCLNRPSSNAGRAASCSSLRASKRQTSRSPITAKTRSSRDSLSGSQSAARPLPGFLDAPTILRG